MLQTQVSFSFDNVSTFIKSAEKLSQVFVFNAFNAFRVSLKITILLIKMNYTMTNKTFSGSNTFDVCCKSSW